MPLVPAVELHYSGSTGPSRVCRPRRQDTQGVLSIIHRWAFPMKAILDVGVVCVIVVMMGAVGMELEGRHFRAVMQRKGTLILRSPCTGQASPASPACLCTSW